VKDLLLPRTDAGVLARAVIATLVDVGGFVVVRRPRELRTNEVGPATVTAAWFALRARH
jgi:hypothetical protein